MRPTTTVEVADLVQSARAHNTPLWLRAGGSKDRLGRRCQPAVAAVDLSGLDGVVTYEPEELILIARPATPLAQVQDLLAQHGQHLAFEPPSWGPGATLGGTVAVGASGPRRFVSGAARDFVLGMEFVDGQGRTIRAGGRVVKNVTGYDLWRSLAGSYGTLGVMTEICLKLWPRPESQATVAVHHTSLDAAMGRMLSWARRPEGITGLACDPTGHLVWARLEGSAQAVRQQADTLLADAGEADQLDDASSRDFWRAHAEAGGLQPGAGQVLYRLAVPPRQARSVVSSLETLGLNGCRLDWAGGLIWAILPDTCPPADVHRVAVTGQGMAARIGTTAHDTNTDAFTPLDPGVARLNETLRRSLDPLGLFTPGRMYPAPPSA